MPDYKKMYLKLFNAVTDAENNLRQIEKMAKMSSHKLRVAQKECEEMVLQSANEEEGEE
ncbi:hypothetical protein FACS1894191_5150 [Clostridia bacterium]|nr:hypothetical protein FACS1894191_5150 [Clostridia bacterium]